MKGFVLGLVFLVGFVGLLPSVGFGQVSKAALNDEILETRDGANDAFNLAVVKRGVAESKIAGAVAELAGLSDTVILGSGASLEVKEAAILLRDGLAGDLFDAQLAFSNSGGGAAGFGGVELLSAGEVQFEIGVVWYDAFVAASTGWKTVGNASVDAFSNSWSLFVSALVKFEEARGGADAVIGGCGAIRAMLGL